MELCGIHRVKEPAGLWCPDELIGAKVKLKSLPTIMKDTLLRKSATTTIKNVFHDSEETLTVDDILLRVSMDGKAVTVVCLKEMPGNIFSLKDLEFVELCPCKKK